MRAFVYGGALWSYYPRQMRAREEWYVRCVFCGEDARIHYVNAEETLFGPDVRVTTDERPVAHVGLCQSNKNAILCQRCALMLRDVPGGTLKERTRLSVPGAWVAPTCSGNWHRNGANTKNA